MSEVTDLVMPVLQRIQADMAALRAKTDDIASVSAETREDVGELRRFITYAMGLTSQQMVRIEEMEKRFEAMSVELKALRPT